MKQLYFLFFLFLTTSPGIFAQNVGIGTNTPGQKLEINGWLRVADESFVGTGTEGTIRYNSLDTTLQFHDGVKWVDMRGGKDNDWARTGGGTPTLGDSIYHMGPVGIGTTTPLYSLQVAVGDVAISGPGNRLWLATVNDTIDLSIYSGAITNNDLVIENKGQGTGADIHFSTGASIVDDGGGGPGPPPPPSPPIDTTLVRMTIKNSGYVGIGTLNPAQQLEVAGWIELGDQDEGGVGTEGTIRYNSTDTVIQFYDGIQWRDVGTGSGTDEDWEKVGGGLPLISDDMYHLGMVGIGTNIPAHMLDVAGNVRVQGDSIFGSANPATQFSLISNGGVRVNLDFNNDGSEMFGIVNSSGTIIFDVTEDGNFTADGNGYVDGDLELTGAAGGRTLRTGDAFNIEGTSGIDIIIDSDDDGTASIFNIKRDGTSGDNIFQVTELGNAHVYADLTIDGLAGSGTANVMTDNTGRLFVGPATGGDITEVQAGAGMIGGATTGIAVLDVQAQNALTVLPDHIELGGSLVKSTVVDQPGAFNFTFDLTGSGAFRVTDSSAAAFYVGADKMVGIGTETPIERLDVTDGNVSISTGGKALILSRDSSTDKRLSIYSGGYSKNDLTIQNRGRELDADINFRLGNPYYYDPGSPGPPPPPGPNQSDSIVTRLTIKSDGNVGIGVATPTHVLHVEGIARSYQSTFATSSDRRVKKNIEDMHGALSTVMQFRPVTYEWTDEYKLYNPGVRELNYGFISQEVQEVMPYMVTEVEEVFGDNKIEDFKLLNMDALIPLLVKSIQEQQEQIATTSQQVEELKQQNEELRSELNELRKQSTK